MLTLSSSRKKVRLGRSGNSGLRRTREAVQYLEPAALPQLARESVIKIFVVMSKCHSINRIVLTSKYLGKLKESWPLLVREW